MMVRLRRCIRGWLVQLRPRDHPDPHPGVPALLSARIADTGLTPTQASVLARVLRGALTARAAAGLPNPARVALAELVNAGLIQPPASTQRGQTYTPDPRVTTSLLLDQPA